MFLPKNYLKISINDEREIKIIISIISQNIESLHNNQQYYKFLRFFQKKKSTNYNPSNLYHIVNARIQPLLNFFQLPERERYEKR